MPVFTEYDKTYRTIQSSIELGEQRFSCFERMPEAIAHVAIAIILLAVTAGVIVYGMQDRQRELLVFGGAIFALIFLVLLLVGIVNVFKARKQIHLFDEGLVQTNHNGNVIKELKFEDVTEFKIQHGFKPGANQIDRYACMFTDSGTTIRFSDYARRYQQQRSQKLHQLISYLRSKMPRDAKSLGNT